jgi:nitrite reductase/ring-hydroxylating ferredoxin subunit
MSRYRDDQRALDLLVQDDRVHRDLYIDPELFQLEMERLWSRTWIYVGHASQVPQAGDFITLDIAAKPLILVRATDGEVRVLMNRCAHKGTKVVYDLAGNTCKTFRCPYHAWTYRTDGTLLNVPLKAGYDGTRLYETLSARGLTPVTHETHRGSSSRGSPMAPGSVNTSATRSPPSTTSPTARPRASSRSPVAASAISTTATGKCSSRT